MRYASCNEYYDKYDAGTYKKCYEEPLLHRYLLVASSDDGSIETSPSVFVPTHKDILMTIPYVSV
ncbi:unnamed protein product, partial [Dovyalis caffra]